MDGWISLHRKLIESEIWEKPPLYIKVWVFLLISAQHTDYKGLKPGQVRTSIPEIIEACKWRVGARIERPTKDQIYQVIEWLRKPNEGGRESNAKATMITTTKATQGMLINISNYGVYQTSDEREGNGESNGEKATKPPRKQRQPNNINNNDNNNNNEQQEKDIYDFWNSLEIIKHRELTQKMKSSINARLKNMSFEEMKEAISNYNAIIKSDLYWYTYKFTLEKFMSPKNIDQFLSENNPFETFKKQRGGGNGGKYGQGHARDAEADRKDAGKHEERFIGKHGQASDRDAAELDRMVREFE
ncbi:hypothetical protein MMB75_25330 [Paenibacillus sp. P2(2022)]|uniref:hypothetical protein n=1 Tax=Paenibacillus sp. P2(2022) TaxID=2917813 RepID=UPI0024071F76|nr:hypothetical protein [Paenibacillus sp. P2(2022)]MDG0056951.1 hypothetical protein [Paenibacillus sp. P2(2022)]